MRCQSVVLLHLFRAFGFWVTLWRPVFMALPKGRIKVWTMLEAGSSDGGFCNWMLIWWRFPSECCWMVDNCLISVRWSCSTFHKFLLRQVWLSQPSPKSCTRTTCLDNGIWYSVWFDLFFRFLIHKYVAVVIWLDKLFYFQIHAVENIISQPSL